jgi:poly(hydroxyalkanoate) depolymerase family esterase
VTVSVSKLIAAPGRWIIPGLPTGLPGLPSASDGAMLNETYRNAFGSRSFQVFVPKKLAADPGLLVVLHGCFMTGEQMATGTEVNRFAAERGFVVVYPEQTYRDNTWKCWNWFKPENQRRDDGELSIIAGMAQTAVKKYQLNAERVFVTGLSAGAAMASNLLGCYSDVFAGAMVHSGLEFAAAQSESEAHQVTKNGPIRDLDQSAQQALQCSPARQRLIPVIVVHGKSDSAVNPINADRTTALFEKINTEIFVRTGGSASEITHAHSRITQDGYKYPAAVDDTLFAGRSVVRKVIVEGMSHAWSGGAPTAPYMEPRGVKAVQILVDTFFPQQ